MILIILPSIICTHLKHLLHSAQKSQQGTLILNLQSLRQKKIMRQKTKVHLMVFKSVSSELNHIKHRLKTLPAYFETSWAFTVNPFRLTFFLTRISFNSFTCIFSTGLSIMNLILFGKTNIK